MILILWCAVLVIAGASVVVGGALVAAGQADEALELMEPNWDWEGERV